MSEYKGLRYKTRGNASPQGRPRVYFCCHEADFARTFEPITEEILAISTNAAFWYYDPAEGIPEDERFFADLSQMQLFVIPVTARFVYQDNRARTVEFQYAIDHHIPVLPLMQEPGLESDFNRVCGDLQFLDKSASQNDPTAIPYEEKLKKFLNSVLVSDALAQRVRAAFDAYIFLSYRKKDRAYAQQIMRLIHSNEFCRDIAIWYDEFLTPGENFNDAIAAAMEKSVLFALVVTPNLLENPNYVMATEYPEARKSGKPILPIEALATDSEELARLFDGIDPTLPPEQVAAQLREVLLGIALLENDNDPAHNFLIGLAYLSGIDVEVDHERALELITSAAEADLPEAYEKLVSMYQTGEGVERNYHTAIEWQKRYVDHLQGVAEADPTEDRLTALFNALWDLGEAQSDVGAVADAKGTYIAMLRCAVSMQAIGHPWAHRDLSVSYNNLGDICCAEGKLDVAKEWYRKALEIDEALARATGTVQARRDLSISYEKLGNISQAQGRLDEAQEWHRKSLEISEALARETGTVQARRDLAISYEKLGDICRAKGKLDEAGAWYRKSLEIDEALARETGTVQARRDLAVSYINLGDISEAGGKLSEVKEWLQKSLEISEALARETGTVQARRDLAISYERLGAIRKEEGRLDEAQEWHRKSLEIREALARETGTVQARRDLLVSYSKMGNISQAEGRLAEAKEWYRKSLEIQEDLARETRTVEARRDLLVGYSKMGDICRTEGKLDEAKVWYQKAMEIAEALARETGTVEARRGLSVSYNNLGYIIYAEGMLFEAKEWYQKALGICEALARETGTVQARRDLAVSYEKLGNISKAEGNLSEAKGWYQKSLELREVLAEETGTIEARQDLAVIYNNLGEISIAERKSSEAKKWHLKSLEISEALARETGTRESLDDLAVDCYNLGTLESNTAAERIGYLNRFLELSKTLYAATNMPRYQQFIQLGEQELAMITPPAESDPEQQM